VLISERRARSALSSAPRLVPYLPNGTRLEKCGEHDPEIGERDPEILDGLPVG